VITYTTMSTSNRPSPITALLRDTIRDAIASGRTNYYALAREADVAKASIMRFVRGTQSLRLDMADRLAAHFGLELRPARRKGRTVIS
jgi:plasmid maintenance system antidote protein VapI